MESESIPKLQLNHKFLYLGKHVNSRIHNLIFYKSVEISGVSNESITQGLLEVTLTILLCNIF